MSIVNLVNDAEDCYAPVYFPAKINDDAGCNESHVTFVEACQVAAESHRPLHLYQDINDLSETIVLRKRQVLSIVGKSPTSSVSLCENSDEQSSSSQKIQIAGKIHSLFLLNNHSQLKLRDLELIHEDNDEDCRNVGAAVNLRYKAKAWLESCSVTSHAGFCCWAVQKATIHLERCYLVAPLRSAVVCFGQACFEGRSCTIANVGVHGVCARGECKIRLFDSSILDSAVRGLYAYANACVGLDGCTIRGTIRPDMAAIEVSTAQDVKANQNTDEAKGKSIKKNAVALEKASSLTMNGCHITDNTGVGVRIRGAVRHNLHSDDGTTNYYDRNLGGNIVELPSTNVENINMNQNEKYRSNAHPERLGSNENDTSNRTSGKFQRDPSGSSFRKGDWWCMECVPKIIVQGSKSSCPNCSCQKMDGKYLSSEEVLRLNRHGDVIESAVARDTSVHSATNLSERARDRPEVEGSRERISPEWLFDGDDSGWLLYDSESSQKLENAYQSFLRLKANRQGDVGEGQLDQELCKEISSTKIVTLSGGRYSVNLETMEQINTSSHFLRLVQRREN